MSDTVSMRIGKVIWHNFGPFEHAEIDFSLLGITTVEGSVLNVKGCNDNGAGKSMLLDGIGWCMSGRCFRADYKGDDVIRRNSVGGCYVDMTIVGLEKPIRIRRHRGFPKPINDRVQVWVGTEETTRGTNPLTDAYIEQLLHMDFLTFMNCVAFSAREDVKGFFAASDADRKRILETILGLEDYAEAEKIVSKRAQASVGKLNQLKIDAQQLRDKAQQDRDTAEQFSSGEDVELARIKIDQLKVRVSQSEGVRNALVKKSKTAAANRKLAQDAYNEDKAAHQGAMEKYNLKVKLLMTQRYAAVKNGAVVEGSMGVLADSIRDLEGIGKECPVCRQSIPSGYVAKLTRQLNDQLKKLGAQADAHAMEAEQKKREIDELTPPAPPSDKNYASAVSECNSAENDLKVAEARLGEIRKTYETAAKDYEQRAGKAEAYFKSADAAEQKAEQLEQEIVALEPVAARQEFWKHGFGNQGVKSFLLESEMPEINRRAMGYARRLLGDGVIVKLAATTALKTKDAIREKLSTVIDIPGMATSFAGASKGQKYRLDVSLLMALRDLQASRIAHGFNQLFIDELLDGMDKTGTEAVAAMLLEMAETQPVFLVTHNDALKGLGKRRVIVHHNGNPAAGTATLEIIGVDVKKAVKKAVQKV